MTNPEPMEPETMEDVRNLLIGRGVPPGVAAVWAATLRPHVELRAGDDMHEDVTPPRSSKFGGCPDLPIGERWPIRSLYQYPDSRRQNDPGDSDKEAPLTFLAQINFADLTNYSLDLTLPSAGHLLFFYDTRNQPWGFDPCDAPASRIIYVQPGTPTERVRHPGGKPLMTRAITMRAGSGLPSWLALRQAVESAIDYDEDSVEIAFEEFESERPDLHGAVGSRFGGYASEIQGAMELECQLVTHGLYCGDSTGYNSPSAAQLAPGQVDWKLLLQLDEEFLADDIVWGDSGMVYFWCRHQDIAACRFDKAWTILQCC